MCLADGRRALAEGRLEDAAAHASEVLASDPDHRDALYLIAVARRYQHRYPEALGALARLTQVAPDYGRAWQERGHTLRALDDPELALECYEQAVTLNPALAASWRALVALRTAAGDGAGAEAARGEASRLKRMAKPVVAASSLFYEGDTARAEALVREHLKRRLNDVEGMRLLAAIGVEMRVLDDAEFLLQSALEFDADFEPARFDLVRVLHRRQKFVAARDVAADLVARRPRDPNALFVLAAEQVATADYDAALEGFDAAIAAAPARPGYRVEKAHALRQLGRTDEAIACYRSAIECQAGYGDAWWSLANLKTYRFDDAEIARMRELEANEALRVQDRVPLAFALGKAEEDRREFEAAFASYDLGNRLQRSRSRYRPGQTTAAVDAQIAAVTPALMAQLDRGGGAQAHDPIFVVGLPRSGSTLIEQILASHPDVDGTTEFHDILALAHRLGADPDRKRDGGYPAVLAALSADERSAFGEAYLEATRFLRSGAPRFVDKMPNNFLHLGLIRAILPNARIIDARRDPMGACFANFKQLFGEGQLFSYGQAEIGQYYRDYLRLMRHFKAVMPEHILTVYYEDVVSDLEGQVRRMLRHLGLEFHPACLEFHTTERTVRTPSSEQVRSPIYRSALEQWRHFEPWLDVLKETLGPLAEPGNYRDD